MYKDRRDMNRIALVTNSAGRSGKNNFPAPTLIVISHELTAEKYSSDELSASRSSARRFSLGCEIWLWINTLVSSRYLTAFFFSSVAGPQTNSISHSAAARRSRRES